MFRAAGVGCARAAFGPGYEDADAVDPAVSFADYQSNAALPLASSWAGRRGDIARHRRHLDVAGVPSLPR